MSKNQPFIKPKRKKNIENLEDTFHNITGQKEIVKLIDFEDILPNENPYPLSDIEEMIESIKSYGILQNLEVLELDNGKYLLNSGHRRYFAVKNILESDSENIYEPLRQLYCKVISKHENNIIVRLRFHETNLQQRSILKMSEEEKLQIVDEYIQLIKQAREQGIKINGKEIKGKTREILAKQFNISSGTAQKLMSKVNNKKESAKNGTQKKEMSEEERKLKSLAEALQEILHTKVKVTKNALSIHFNDIENCNDILDELGLLEKLNKNNF
jgi:ParB-like nuclease domain.